MQRHTTPLNKSLPDLWGPRTSPTRITTTSDTTVHLTTTKAATMGTASARGLMDSGEGAGFRPLPGPSLADSASTKTEQSPKPPRCHNDVHFHHTNYAQQGSLPQDLLPAMHGIGVLRTVLMPIPTNQLGSCHGAQYAPAKGMASNAPNYYLPDKVRQGMSCTATEYQDVVTATPPLYYNTSVDDMTAAMFKALPPDHQELFDPSITGVVLGDQRCAEDLLMKLRRHPGVFTCLGEITIHKEFVEHKLDARVQGNLKDKAQPIKDLLRTCGEIGMPVILHCDVDSMPHVRGRAPAHLEGMKALLKDPACQKTSIIWAHAGGLGKYSQARPEHLENLLSILDDPAFDHVHFDLSWDVVAQQLLQIDPTTGNHAIDKAKLNRMAMIIESFPDRFLFGSDALAPRRESDWASTIVTYEPLLESLTPDTTNKILIDNYERIIVDARSKVRAYERHCLPYASIAILMRQDTLAIPSDFRSWVLEQVQMGIAYGRECIAYEKKIGRPPPVRPPELVDAADLERHALQIRPGDGTRMRKATL